MTIQSKIAALGENPTFIAAMAHTWFAFAVVTVLSHYLPLIPVQIACTALAAGKEFWFDLRYEITPRQTLLDSTGDMLGYVAGITLATVWLATHNATIHC